MPYEAVPYFWTDQYDVKLQAAGFPALADEVHLLEREGDRFVAVGEHDGHAISAVAWNAPRRLMLYRRALAGAPTVDDLREQLADSGKALAPWGKQPARPDARRGSPMTALVLQHGEWGPPGILGAWAADRGVPLEVHRTDLEPGMPALNGHAFVASLGSPHNPTDTHVPEIAAELELLGEAVDRDLPVLGLCFGGQMLAKVLGGEIEHAPEPEFAWHWIDTDDPERVPEGPWLEWHYDRFTLPPGATELARTPIAVQAFEHGRHLGTQFHPESTMEIVREWANAERNQVRSGGVDGDALLDAGAHHAGAARGAAYKLFDAFWERVRRGGAGG